MRILCFERDNVTQWSDPDQNGDMYTASFELFPFYEGATFSFYTGLLSGNGALRGQFCVVRSLLDKDAEASDWVHFLRRAKEAQRLATEFNKGLGYNAIRFLIPMLTQIDTVSDFACMFRCLWPHDKRLKHDEFVALEPFLEGTFQHYDYRPGFFSPSRETSPKADNLDDTSVHSEASNSVTSVAASTAHSTNLAQAFSHFTWHNTRNLVICDLQGVYNGLTFTLTNPIIHSLSSAFGETDGGSQGISEFFTSHRCNNICCNWDIYNPYRNAQNQINLFKQPSSFSCYNYNPAEPSAPIDLGGNCLHYAYI